MKVSVCIPVYNGEAFIAETIKSALDQTCGDIEVLVCDNRSTDRTADIVASFHDARVRWVTHEENVGPVGNFNRCLTLARGHYIKILCADDLLYPDCVRRQMDILEADRDERLALVSCARDIVDDRGKVRMRPDGLLEEGVIPARRAIKLAVRSGTNPFGEPQSVLFRASLARRVGPFDASWGFCLDIDYWFRLMAHGDLYRIREPLCAFRVSGHSWSTGLAGRQANEFTRFIDAYKSGNPDAFSDYDRAIGMTKAHANGIFRRLFYSWLSFTN